MYDVYGCADPYALNYDSRATVTAGCVAAISGCTDSHATNFAADHNVPDPASCTYSVPGGR